MPKITISPASPADASGVSCTNVICWKETYRGIFPDEILDSLDFHKGIESRRKQLEDEIRERKEITYVAENDRKEIVGFTNVGSADDPLNCTTKAEIRTIYLLKKYQGMGLGKKLFLTAIGWAKEHDFRSLRLWVLERNATRGFYEKMGGMITARKFEKRYNNKYEVICYSWCEIDKIIP